MPEDDTRPLTTGEWFVTLLILAIPLVNIIMMFVWAFGSGNIGRRNLCRAYLIWVCIAIGLGIVFALVGGVIGAIAASQGGGY